MDSSSSKRKGQPHIEKRISLKIGEDSNDKLIGLAQSSKLTKRFIMEFFIDLGHKYGFLKDGWEGRLRDALNLVDENRSQERARNKFAALDDACPALNHDEDKKDFVCVWARLNKPPIVKRLGKDYDEAEIICVACGRTREILEGIAGYEDEIKTLRAEVGRGVVVRIPSCMEGGRISDDGKKLYCARTTTFVSVQNHCKVLRRGANCKSLRWTTLSVKGEFAEPER